MFRTIARSVSSCIAATIVMLPVALADDTCPNPLGGSAVQDGNYSFAYRSWSWPRSIEHDFAFSHCVRNRRSDRALYVRWDGVGLSGFAAPNDTIYVYETHMSDAHDEKNVALWYGAGLKQLNVETLFPKYKRESSIRVPTVDLVATTNVAPAALESYGRFAVPLFANGTDFRRIIEAIESDPNVLRTFQMEFRSTVALDRGEIREIHYECRYRFDIPHFEGGVVPVFMRISNAELHQRMFRDDQPILVGDWVRFGPAGPSFEATLKPSHVPSDMVKQRQSALEVLGPDRQTVLGSIPVRFFAPQ
jgi:hypothetical protein